MILTGLLVQVGPVAGLSRVKVAVSTFMTTRSVECGTVLFTLERSAVEPLLLARLQTQVQSVARFPHVDSAVAAKAWTINPVQPHISGQNVLPKQVHSKGVQPLEILPRVDPYIWPVSAHVDGTPSQKHNQ